MTETLYVLDTNVLRASNPILWYHGMSSIVLDIRVKLVFYLLIREKRFNRMSFTNVVDNKLKSTITKPSFQIIKLLIHMSGYIKYSKAIKHYCHCVIYHN